jgi:DNA-binding GntR family transcriptional regulator
MSVDLRSSVTTLSPGEETYAAIRRGILDGALRPGERIVEQQLAETLKVSRTPVREALLKLERENLVARMDRGMAVKTYSSDEVRDIYDLRAQIEGYSARVACERITDAEITALERVQEELEAELERSDVKAAEGMSTLEGADVKAAESMRTLAALNQRFHGVLVRSVRSAPLERCFVQVVQLPLLYKAYLWYDEDAKRSSASDHRVLIDLLRARDGQGAEPHWRRHVERGRDVLVEHLTENETHEP